MIIFMKNSWAIHGNSCFKPKSVIRVYLKQIAIIAHNFITNNSLFLTHKATFVAQIMVITIIRF